MAPATCSTQCVSWPNRRPPGPRLGLGIYEHPQPVLGSQQNSVPLARGAPRAPLPRLLWSLGPHGLHRAWDGVGLGSALGGWITAWTRFLALDSRGTWKGWLRTWQAGRGPHTSICCALPPRGGIQQVLNECLLTEVHPGPAHLLHGLLVVPEVLQLPPGPLRELLEDLRPPGGGLGWRDGQGECLHRGGQACGPATASGPAARPTHS